MLDRRLFRYLNTLVWLIILVLCCCFYACKSTSSVGFPRIEEPDFSISSIRIMQAELINTRFFVRLRIDNPNPFPVTLSSFSYRLYGSGLFWAEGTDRDNWTVPAMESAEKELFLVMNFIDTRRDLLDRVIAMQWVAYQFSGTVEIQTPGKPVFIKRFDLRGESEVTR